MQSVDLVYVRTMTAMLEMFRVEYDNACAAYENEHAERLDAQIAELRARRDRVMASVFGPDPVIGSNSAD